MQKFNNCYLCNVICYINLLELIFVLFSPKLGTGSNKISMYLTWLVNAAFNELIACFAIWSPSFWIQPEMNERTNEWMKKINEWINKCLWWYW